MINFKNYEFFYEPFPHGFVNDIFDLSFYDQLCNEFPSEDLMEEISSKILDEKRFKKLRLENNFNKKKFNDLLKKKKNINEFYKYVNSNIFLNKILFFLKENHVNFFLNTKKNFYDYLINKLRKKDLSFDFEFSSIPVEDGYIAPHTDGRDKVLAIVIPIIDDESILNIENLGTKILKANKDEYKFNYENRIVPIKHTDEIRILPFKKNMMSIHVKTFNSLHAVGPFKENTPSPITRKSISMFLRQG